MNKETLKLNLKSSLEKLKILKSAEYYSYDGKDTVFYMNPDDVGLTLDIAVNVMEQFLTVYYFDDVRDEIQRYIWKYSDNEDVRDVCIHIRDFIENCLNEENTYKPWKEGGSEMKLNEQTKEDVDRAFKALGILEEAIEQGKQKEFNQNREVQFMYSGRKFAIRELAQ